MSLDLLSAGELARLDVAISVIPEARLHHRAGLLLMRHGVLPADVCRLPRAGFTEPTDGYPGQVVYDRRGQAETTLLSAAASQTITRLLASHDSPLIVPGMSPDRLTSLLAERSQAAGVRPITPDLLRNTVRLAALSTGETP